MQNTYSVLGASTCIYTAVTCPAGTYAVAPSTCSACNAVRSMLCAAAPLYPPPPPPPLPPSAGLAPHHCYKLPQGNYSQRGAASCAYTATSCPAGTYAVAPVACSACTPVRRSFRDYQFRPRQLFLNGPLVISPPHFRTFCRALTQQLERHPAHLVQRVRLVSKAPLAVVFPRSLAQRGLFQVHQLLVLPVRQALTALRARPRAPTMQLRAQRELPQALQPPALCAPRVRLTREWMVNVNHAGMASFRALGPPPAPSALLGNLVPWQQPLAQTAAPAQARTAALATAPAAIQGGTAQAKAPFACPARTARRTPRQGAPPAAPVRRASLPPPPA
jgi:hypothetical protein